MQHAQQPCPTSTTSSTATLYCSWRDIRPTKFPTFKRPKQVGNFCLDARRQLALGSDGLKEYVECEPGVSLEDGYEDRFVERDQRHREYLDHLLSWAVLTARRRGVDVERQRVSLRDLVPPHSVVCWRGLLTKIMAAPIERRRPVSFVAYKLQGCLLLCEYESAAEASGRVHGMSDGQRRACYAGYRFESYATRARQEQRQDTRTEAAMTSRQGREGGGEREGGRDDPSEITAGSRTESTRSRGGGGGGNTCSGGGDGSVQEHAQKRAKLQEAEGKEKEPGDTMMEACGTALHADFGLTDETCKRAVVNTNEGYCCVFQTRLQDISILSAGEVDCVDSSTNEYIELKTINEEAMERPSFKRFKLMKWWAQSFLIGIPRIVYGVRSNDNRLLQTRSLPVHHIPRMARDAAFWEPATCMAVAAQVLQTLQRTCSPNRLFLVQADPSTRAFHISPTQDPDHRFLPSWFCRLVGDDARSAQRQ